MRVVQIALWVVVAIAASVYGVFAFTPWPSVLVMRHTFDQGGAARNLALMPYVPANVSAFKDLRYGGAPSSTLDVFEPSSVRVAGAGFPAVVWIHGGAFVAGSKNDVEAYLRILAARGYATVGVGYALAPIGRYPMPIAQANEAVAFVIANAARLHVDPTRIFLAGDSAGAQIAAQLAAMVSDPTYAAQVGIAPGFSRSRLRGVVLFCGIYDASPKQVPEVFRTAFQNAFWAYFGQKNLDDNDTRLAQFAVARHVTPRFPPAFISAGNTDPLERDSVMLANALRAQGVTVDTLFFPSDYVPPEPHEYQFTFGSGAGKKAIARETAFLARFSARNP